MKKNREIVIIHQLMEIKINMELFLKKFQVITKKTSNFNHF